MTPVRPATRTRYQARVDQARRDILRGALVAHGGNVSAAARTLGLQRTYLCKLLRRWVPEEWARRVAA